MSGFVYASASLRLRMVTLRFMFHRVTVGWRDLLRGLLRRRLEVVVIVGGDSQIVEDVCELDADYLGAFGSSRQREWNESMNARLVSAVSSSLGGTGE